MEPTARRLAPYCLATIVFLWVVGLGSSPTLSARESDSDSQGSTPTSSAPPPYDSGRVDGPPLPDSLYFEFGMEELYRRANLSIEEVFAHVGLRVPENCLDFSDRTRLERRRRRWRHALRILRSTHPERVYGWLIGRRSPPDLALAEARHQRNCLIDGMFEGASEPDQFSAEIEDLVPRTPSTTTPTATCRHEIPSAFGDRPGLDLVSQIRSRRLALQPRHHRSRSEVRPRCRPLLETRPRTPPALLVRDPRRPRSRTADPDRLLGPRDVATPLGNGIRLLRSQSLSISRGARLRRRVRMAPSPRPRLWIFSDVPP